MLKRKKNPNKKKLPVAVPIIAAATVVLFVIRLYQVYDPVIRRHIFQNGLTGPLVTGLRLTELGSNLLSTAAYLFLAFSGLVVLTGFLTLRRWSWVLLMVWTGASLTVSLVDYFTSRSNYIVMSANVIVAFALNIPEVQRVYKIRKKDEPAH